MTDPIKTDRLKTDIQNDHLWEFPMQYPVKVVGEARYPMREIVANILLKHVPDFDPFTLTEKISAAGNYTSVTALVYVERKEQINGMYADFAAHQHIKMVL
jgi:putative lipoic acid-binding regulatory protein